LLTKTNFIVADNHPIKKPKNIKAKFVRDGVPLSIHLRRNTIAQTIKIPMLYIVHDLYGLDITLMVSQNQ
jgi:hypothetical protein